ncbi:hypothetical protein Tco_1230291 [Tanacetum coccineum]
MQSCLLYHLRLPTLPSIPILSQAVFWGADEKISDGGSPRVIVYGYDGLPMQPVAPPSPDYIPDPEEPQTPPLYTMEDEHVFPAEEQPLPPVDHSTAKSPGRMRRRRSTQLRPTPLLLLYLLLSLCPHLRDEPVYPPPSTDISNTGARITVRLQASIPLPPEAEVERLLAMTTPSPSPPISLSPPSAGEHLARCTAPPTHSSLPPMPSPLLPSSVCPTQIQTLKIASTQALIDAVTAALPSPPLPPLPPSLYIPPPVDRRDDVPESELPPRKRLCLSTLGPRYEIGESSTARPIRGRGIDYGFVSTVDAEARRQWIDEVGYGIRDTWVDPAIGLPRDSTKDLGEDNTKGNRAYESTRDEQHRTSKL